ncbi:MAG TPA: GNAT family N-acetyltransferase, partial [Lysinibacillus sp.]|nr:GNAT family N-acetyltransferase [Lysinibacillus sp.]
NEWWDEYYYAVLREDWNILLED